jgi:hypothetical protein
MGLIVGTVTNGNANAWAVEGLKDVIHFAVDAHEAGCAKPGAPIFHLVGAPGSSSCKLTFLSSKLTFLSSKLTSVLN